MTTIVQKEITDEEIQRWMEISSRPFIEGDGKEITEIVHAFPRLLYAYVKSNEQLSAFQCLLEKAHNGWTQAIQLNISLQEMVQTRDEIISRMEEAAKVF